MTKIKTSSIIEIHSLCYTFEEMADGRNGGCGEVCLTSGFFFIVLFPSDDIHILATGVFRKQDHTLYCKLLTE